MKLSSNEHIETIPNRTRALQEHRSEDYFLFVIINRNRGVFGATKNATVDLESRHCRNP